MSDSLDVKGIAARQRALLESGALSRIGSAPSQGATDLSPLERILAEFGEYLTTKTPQVLDELGLVSSKELKQSGTYDVIVKGPEILSLRFYLASHWVNVHYGEKRSRSQGAKPPPLAAIERWISYKGIQVRESADQPVSEVLDARRALAERIRMAIWRRGYTIKRFGPQGSRFLDRVLDQESLDALGQLAGELGAAVAAFDILSVVPIDPRNGSAPR